MKTSTPVAGEVPAKIREQLTADPQLPRATPTQSPWQEQPHPEVGHIQSASLPTRVDFAVIGSGVAALGVTRSLLTNVASGTSTVAVFEARGLCSGATGRNGGQLTRLPPPRHTFMVKRFGVEQANKVMRLTVKGLDKMHQLAEAQGDEFLKKTRRTRLEKFFAYYDEASWNETIEAIKLYEQEIPEDKGVYRQVSKEETASVYGLNGAYGGLRFPAGVISPYQLVTGTFSHLLKQHGGRLTIETNTPVTAVSWAPDAGETAYPYIIQTPRGPVRAGQVVHCTNGYAGHLLPGLRGKMYPRRGTMSVQRPGPSFPRMSGKQSWSFYFTPEHDRVVGDVETGRYYGFQNGDSGDLWIGGDRDSIDSFISTDDSRIDHHADKNLRGVLPRLFGREWIQAAGDVRAIWTGVMCYTGDHMPFIGRLPSSATGRPGAGEWIAGGWNTYGMTNGFICGDALGKIMLGEDVSEWFPDIYRITEQRLGGDKFKLEAVLRDYFERIGAHEYIEPRAQL
ncbi:FAD dependent oxidoreductase-domain-containing protein [Microdochium trichocladiopsis]|uniref:FAD dependent oxidoreductase-domain-containing protein n=1 Tax=Microdochium trichocladiopsis TaxID=1682393 RepID=A0A9P8XXR6_9PEZI|nr:FAD dependent oxidoreductase-domain-containing protein [Microdochium trichocladiopsis]KAH7024768.1 FAD dependent oxidoreductase-domain-containing protein [Microdochium trichocladiopsis]